MVQLTELAHQYIRQVVTAGDIVIDATAGNGHDTLFLSKLVGESGRVIACDIQVDAIESTKERCTECHNIEFHQGDHAELLSNLAQHLSNQVAGIMFNLGYLPGGDKSISTHSTTTIAALDATMQLLKQGGILSVLAYPGHTVGREETNRVSVYLSRLLSAERVDCDYWPNESFPLKNPRLYIFRKK